MKIKHFFGLAVIAAMTASCSSNEDLGTAGPGTGTNEAGVGYAAFNINLPSVSGTRAEGDNEPNFNEGDAKEYDVNNATLLIFKAPASTTTTPTPTENDYTFVESVDLGSMEPWTKDGADNDGITTKAKIVAKLDKVTSKEDLYALVILNNKDKDGNLKVAMPKAPTETALGQTYKDWNEKATNATTNGNAILDNKKGFYMANAPLYDKTNSKVTTLVQIKKDLIFPTEIKAAASEGNDIYVERGVAKVTMSNATKGEKTVADGTYKNDKVTIANWGLDVTNKKTYPVHKTDDTGYTDIWKFNTAASTVNSATISRFFDSSSACLAKRVYWGVDPNYNNNDLYAVDKDTERGKNFNYIKKGDISSDVDDGVEYCLENTFNLANMTQGQTTRVVFKAKYTPGTFTDGETFYKIGKNIKLWHEADLVSQIKAAVSKVVPGASEAGTKIDVDLDATENKLTVAGNKVLATSNIKVNAAALTQPQVDAVNEKLGLTAESGISTFESGFTYYIARVKHFGDGLTPWKVDYQKYGDDNISFLGRYGMLRNNWYELTVNSVSGPGYPDVPEVKPNTPDDDDDKYVSVSVKILDWAKRSQTVDL